MDKIITEDYVSYDTAKLLREKGFDEPCRSAYLWNGEEEELCTSFSNHIQFNSEDCEDGDIPRISAPTFQMAMKWLRKVHHKYCDIRYDIDLYWFFHIIELKELKEHFDYSELKYYHTENEIGFNSYEEACEASIKYTLENLI